MGTLLTRPPGQRRDIVLRPAATAMVWVGDGHPHETIAVPGVALGAHDLLVAIELSTICESDLHALRIPRSIPTPAVLGHESVGRVIATGDDGAFTVDGSRLRIGDRVVWTTTVSCGTCDRCDRGLASACRTLGAYGRERIGAHGDLAGAFASHLQVREGTAIVRVPESLPASVLAPAACTAATARAAVDAGARDRSLDGATVRIHGASLLGLTAAAMAAEAGADVEVIDAHPLRASEAPRFGAAGIDRDPDVVIETTGRAVSRALDEVGTGGTVVLAGIHPAEAVPFDAESIVRRLVTVTAVSSGTGLDLAAAVAFLAGRGRAYPFADAVGEVRQLTAIDAALLSASAADAPLRIGLIPGP